MPLRPLLTGMLLLAAACAQAQTFSFGLWGDMPYKRNSDDPKMPALIASLNRADIAFSIYDGDFKDGSSVCNDDSFASALALFGQLDKPLIYVAGDNEWTDCHRLNNGGYDGLERLAYLRKTMFATPGSLGKQKLALTHQGRPGEKMVENTRFEQGGIVFATFNVPGSNNNQVLDARDCSRGSARSPAQCDASNAEFAERDFSNRQWLKQAFDRARSSMARGVVLVIQGDPGFDLPETETTDESELPRYSGYRAFMRAVAVETEQFAGQVLFVHGDTHFFKLDKPLYSPSRVLPNFTRLQTFGSPHIHWVRVTVDDGNPNLFTVQPVMVKHD